MPDLKIAITGDELPPELKAQILAAVGDVRQLLPFSAGLSARERLTYPALGEKGTQFVQKAVESMRINTSLLPGFVELSEVESLYAMYNDMLAIDESIQQLERLASDTMHIAGNQARNMSLAFYNSVQRGAISNVPGAQSVLENLKTRFNNVGRPKGKKTVPVNGGTAPE